MENRKKIIVILTCFNRKNKTRQCIESIYDERLDMEFVITNDGSSDGTDEVLIELSSKYKITVLNGTGELYWCGGMNKAIKYVLDNSIQSDYVVYVNDDVDFYPDMLNKMINQCNNCDNATIVGVTCNEKSEITYGGIKYNKRGIKYETIGCDKSEILCDTFNCNCVLLPFRIFQKTGNFDGHFTHAMGDFDYGLRISKLNLPIHTSNEYVGICEKNTGKNLWDDLRLTRRQRLIKKESSKGLPFKEWFYFLNTHFGLRTAVLRSITPYIKILIKR